MPFNDFHFPDLKCYCNITTRDLLRQPPVNLLSHQLRKQYRTLQRMPLKLQQNKRGNGDASF